MAHKDFDYDWIVIGSGFGGSVSALRLTEKGYRVLVVERGRRFREEDLPQSGWQLRKSMWEPRLGLKGIMRTVVFKHVGTSAQTGVGGGSIVYGGVLYRAKPAFFTDPQWRDLARWDEVLRPHYETAEHMLGVRTVPFDSPKQQLMLELAKGLGVEDSFNRAPCGVFFGEPGKTVADPYFGGTGPDRTGCTRCGSCMVGCQVGAVNTLTKNYLWFAEKHGAQIIAEREVVDVKPLGAADGSDGYRVETRFDGADGKPETSEITARGVIFAGGTLGTNELLANCKHGGSLPRISDRLGDVVRTNSETILNVRLPKDLETWRDVAASSSIHLDADTTLEFLTHGTQADMLSLLHTLLSTGGNRFTRPLKLLGRIITHPRQWLISLWPFGWSRRMIMLLVMQSLDNAIAFRAKKGRSDQRYHLVTAQDPKRPIPTSIPLATKAAEWLAKHTGGIAQSGVFEAWKNIPTTAHVLGGAVPGADETTGVIDRNLHVFGYRNMLVCDAAAMPANPGANPALTITALAEYAMSKIPPAQEFSR